MPSRHPVSIDTMARREIFKTPSTSSLKKRRHCSIANILQDYKQGKRQEYDSLLHSLLDPDIDSATLLMWLKDLKNCTSLMTKEFEPLVRAILMGLLHSPTCEVLIFPKRIPADQVKWCHHDKKVVQAYQEVLENLVSAHTVYLTHILATLTQCLVPQSHTDLIDGKDHIMDREYEAREKKKFITVHTTLKILLHIAPVTPRYLIATLGDSFPWTGESAHILDGYIKNLLEIASYLPELRSNIFELILHKMTELDVNAPKNEIIESSQDSMRSSSEGQDIDNDDTQFSMEGVEESDVKKVSDKDTNESVKITHEVALKLDQLMCTVMEYLHNKCFINGEFMLEEARALHRNMLLVFEKVVLRTHGSSHVQFLFFYFCSFRQVIVDAFLEHLWKKFLNPNTPAVIRQVAVSYIASFIARADFIPLSTVTACLDLMTNWLHSYIDNHESVSQRQAYISVHLPFYSLCQAVFYMFVFRHQQLMEDNKGLRYVMGLNLERIVTCRLNPLRVCLPSIVNVFATLARSYQVAFCYTILERNARCMLPIMNSDPNGVVAEVTRQNPLDSFFPFDPYLLPRSGKLIEGLYKKWEGCREDNEPKIQDEDDEFVQYDDLDKDLPLGITPTSAACVSPGFISSSYGM